MNNELPLFPLGLVVFPKEDLNLHIFEPRYKQLITDAQAADNTFGIPSFINNQVSDYGTQVKIVSIERVYEDGRMDIKTRGLQVFKVRNFENPWKEKLYAGGHIEWISTSDEEDPILRQNLLERLEELYKILQVNMNLSSDNLLSYEVAHKIGLSLEQEYELLILNSEKDRQSYILDHLEQAIPVINEMERTKELIRMNGHFRHFDPLNF